MKPLSFAELLATSSVHIPKLNLGDEIKGKVISFNSSEVVFDIGAKAEGIVNKKDLTDQQLDKLKIEDTMTLYVLSVDNDSGQIMLSPYKKVAMQAGRGIGKGSHENLRKWQKLIQASQQGSKLGGRVIEVNKGGLIIEVDSIRGFLPFSQLGFKTVESLGGKELNSLIGENLLLKVLEVDMDNHRLIFSGRDHPDETMLKELSKFSLGQRVKGKVLAVTPLGIFVKVGDVEGLILGFEVSWEKIDDLTQVFKVGDEIEGVVSAIDNDFGRINISLRKMQEDPFEQVVKNYMVDDVVKGTVVEVLSNGTRVMLEEGIEGFIPVEKIERGGEYTPGQSTNFLVDEIDMTKRRVNLAPFLTSTKGLLYK